MDTIPKILKGSEQMKRGQVEFKEYMIKNFEEHEILDYIKMCLDLYPNTRDIRIGVRAFDTLELLVRMKQNQ